MRKLLVAPLALLVLAAPGRAVDSAWDGASGLLPDQLPRPYAGVDTADPEDPTLVGGVLTLETSENAEVMYYLQSGADLAPPDPWVIEFEMRFVSGASSNALRGPVMVFLTTQPDTGAGLHIDADSIFLLADSSTVGPAATPDTDDAFHTYRLEVFGDGSIDVYQDDGLILEGDAYVSTGDHGGTPRIGFGAASIGSLGVSEWGSFGHNGLAVLCGDGVVDPPEACDDGNTAPGDGCDAACLVESICAPAPAVGCHVAAKASLAIVEKKPGSEKLKAKLGKFVAPTGPMDLGDPVGGATRYDLCLYDGAGQPVGELSVDRAGQLCGAKQKPCWKAKGDQGYAYGDPDAAASGVKKIAAKTGPEGKGKLQLQAGNKAKKGQTAMPTGLAAALQGATSALVQLVTSDGLCFEAGLDTVKKNDGVQFKGNATGALPQ